MLNDKNHFKSKRLAHEIETNKRMKLHIPNENYLSIMDLLSDSNYVRVTDSQNKLLSVDRTHLTKPGAIFLGEKLLATDIWVEILGKSHEN